MQHERSAPLDAFTGLVRKIERNVDVIEMDDSASSINPRRITKIFIYIITTLPKISC